MNLTQSSQGKQSFTEQEYNKLSQRIIECCIEVHKELGPLKLADKKLGLLVNFNVPLLKEGIRRKINGNLNSV